MRLPLISQLSTKDGISNKNARLTNVLKETAAQGTFAVVRPGLDRLASTSGNGNGLVNFNESLISVYGATVGFNDINDAVDEQEAVSPVTTLINLWSAITLNEITVLIVGSTGSTGMLVSYNLVDWNAVSPVSSYGVSIAAGNGVFCCMGDVTKSMTSADGINWTLGTQDFNGDSGTRRSLTFANGYFFCQSTTGPELPIAYRSTDGLSWESITLPSFAFRFCGNGDVLCCVSWSGTSIYTSYDNGTTWATTTTFVNSIRDVVFHKDRFVTVSNDGLDCFTSTDGITWVSITPPLRTAAVNPVNICNGRKSLAVFYVTDGVGFVAFLDYFGAEWVSIQSTLYAANCSAVYDGFSDAFVLERNVFGNSRIPILFRESPEQVKPLTALSGDFFDFAQSTL